MSGVGDDDSEEWDDPIDSNPESGSFGAGFIVGILFALVLQLALVGAWYIIVRVIL